MSDNLISSQVSKSKKSKFMLGKKAKRGRPRIGDGGKTLKTTKPWEKLGMSQSTWDRRRREIDAERTSGQ